jgi:flagellar basal-body rod protein FlgB
LNFIDPATLQLVSRALDAGALRHQAIAQNIANANIAGAKATRVQFEELLGQVQGDVATGHSFKAEDVPVPRAVPDASGHAISLDEEMAAMSSNSLQYQALLKATSRQLSILSIAVQEGRR